MGPDCSKVQVLAKIDCLEALHNIEAIIKAADGLILNRTELGMELPPEKLIIA
jgi:pyruvate kinase